MEHRHFTSRVGACGARARCLVRRRPHDRLPPPTTEQQILGGCRPSGWVLQKLDGDRGPGRGIIHAVDCEEAPAGAPVLTLDKALDAAEHPGTQLCSLCGAAAELDPILNGFDHSVED